MERRNLLLLATALLVSFVFVDIASAYYNPSTGRFLGRDPVGEPGFIVGQQVHAQQVGGAGFIPRDPYPSNTDADGLNTYAAMQNDPTIYIDPLGASAQKAGQQKQYDAGPMHPGCCYAVFGLCLLQGNSISQCATHFDECWNRSIPNPCHAGNIIDPVCWYVRGSKGCKKPDTCFLYLFPLCDMQFGTHPKTGQPIYGAHIFRFCSMRLSWPIIHIGTMTDKWPAGCMDACERYKRADKAHAMKNCGCDYSCMKCKDFCGPGPHPTFVGGWGKTPPRPIYR
jgi:hypothetical protein